MPCNPGFCSTCQRYFKRVTDHTKRQHAGFKFSHPACTIVVGPSRSGKSTLVAKLQHMLVPKPKHTTVIYSAWQPIYDTFKNATFIQGWSSDIVDRLEDDSLVIIDDLMQEAKDCPQLGRIFTKYSHHKRLSVFLLTQNLFPTGKECRNVSLNAQYIVLFPSARDRQQIRVLSQQMRPEQPELISAIFTYVTSQRPYNPLLIDLLPTTAESRRIVSDFMTDTPIYYNGE